MVKYQAIVFDLGNVVINYSFDNTFYYWAKVSGCDVNMIKQKFEFDEIYRRFEKGEIKPDIYRKNVLEKLGLHLNEVEFDNGWNQIYLDLTSGIEQLLRDLKSRFRLVALTNTNEIHANHWKIKYASMLSNFEKVFCSHEIKARKPEKEVFKIVLNYLQLKPNYVVYLDDRYENIKSASEIGIKSILVNSPHQIIRELQILGII